MTLTTMPCPRCGDPLVLETRDTFNPWVCKNGDGLGFTITEAYDHIQEDEITAIWEAAKTASVTELKSPILGRRMVSVSIQVDADEDVEVAPGSPTISVEVDPYEQFIWLDAGELEQFPEDRPDPEPSAEELKKLKEITNEFGREIKAANQARLDKTLVERFYKATNPQLRDKTDRFIRKVTPFPDPRYPAQ